MLQVVSFAHAEETNFSVLHVEALIRELSTVEGCEGFSTLDLDLAHLDEHALDDAVDFGLSVTDKFSLFVFQLTAEGDKVGTSSGSDLVEELDDYLRVNAVDGEHELSVLLVSGVVNLVTVVVSSDLGVFFEGTVIEVIEIVQGVAEELFVRAKVLSSNGISHGVVIDGN